MNQSFQQFIYNNAQSSKNYPPDLTKEALISGNFLPANKTISQLGVRALPGTKFYLNDGAIPIIVGFTGLFEIDLTDGGSIGKMTIDAASLERIEDNDSAYLVIDIAYWGS